MSSQAQERGRGAGSAAHAAKEETLTAAGRAGFMARGTVLAAAGIFILIAAVQFDADEAKGVDATLHSFTHRALLDLTVSSWHESGRQTGEGFGVVDEGAGHVGQAAVVGAGVAA
ncbi:hypothetical protein [Streptomyces aureoverticillatus]|uniref:hypothetical protein n=1 Tax=Streptomyces aureoverticillatus TaxID=66871 RepID=UPI0013DA5306|nr:hypothetical protein [Streptomyces aureoverticillatus]QIB48258.1 hypothetical protein G3H79_39470 [Streptomyces aureoverticillatus]